MGTKKKKAMFEAALCTPVWSGQRVWVHTILAAVILVLAFVDQSWAEWGIVLAAAWIFLSGVVTRCFPR